jgi:hypothetical protein
MTDSFAPPAAVAVTPVPAQSGATRRLPLLSFAAALVSFLLTFVTFSCQGKPVAMLSGVQLALGTTVEGSGNQPKKIEPEPLALVALAAAVAGFALSFGGMNTKTLTILSGAAGVICLFMLKSKLEGDILKQGGGFIQIDFGAGFWIAVVAFVIGAIAAARLTRTASPP